MYKKIALTVALLCMGHAQAAPPRSTPAVINNWLKVMVALSAGFATQEALSDARLFTVMNRAHDAYVAKRTQKDSILGKLVGRAKAKSDLYTKMLENRELTSFIYTGTRTAGAALSAFLAYTALTRTLG